MVSEAVYQSRLKQKLEKLFPGCVVLKNDSGYMQGVPDLTIFHNEFWATLEVKESKDAPEQPNQDYYVNLMNGMSFSAFIYPENEEQVLRDLQHAFSSERAARIS